MPHGKKLTPKEQRDWEHIQKLYTKKYLPGEIIVQAGQKFEDVFRIEVGLVQLVCPLPGGEQQVQTLTERDFIGLIELFAECDNHLTTAIASTEVTVTQAPLKVLGTDKQRTYKCYPDLILGFAKYMATRMSLLLQEKATLLHKKAETETTLTLIQQRMGQTRT
ncbi:MAG: Crp/Fnr family transcriptional regulator [bacterium]|nr:Crp/Fnr family transcriptional regulator [bacterium]